MCAPEEFVKGNADATAVIHICSMKRYGMFRDGRSAPRQSPHRPNVVNRGASSSLYASEIESSIMARRSPSRTLVRTPSRITSNAVPMTTGRWMLRRKIDSCPRLGQIKWPQVRSREGKLDLGYEGEQTTKSGIAILSTPWNVHTLLLAWTNRALASTLSTMPSNIDTSFVSENVQDFLQAGCVS